VCYDLPTRKNDDTYFECTQARLQTCMSNELTVFSIADV